MHIVQTYTYRVLTKLLPLDPSRGIRQLHVPSKPASHLVFEPPPCLLWCSLSNNDFATEKTEKIQREGAAPGLHLPSESTYAAICPGAKDNCSPVLSKGSHLACTQHPILCQFAQRHGPKFCHLNPPPFLQFSPAYEIIPTSTGVHCP